MNLTSLESWIARKVSVDKLTRPELEVYQMARLQETLRLAREKSSFLPRALDGLLC